MTAPGGWAKWRSCPTHRRSRSSGLLFFNTLFDENAASHIALGQCYSTCFKDGAGMTADEIARRGGNKSLIHIDWMIGSGEIDIDGLAEDGRRHAGDAQRRMGLSPAAPPPAPDGAGQAARNA